MKYLLMISPAICLVVFFSCKSEKKADNCKEIHKGTFYFYPKSSEKKYKIIRDDKTQKEITLSSGDTSVYKISWIDDCSYSLKHISGGKINAGNDSSPKIFVQFLTLTSNYYLMRVSMDSLYSGYSLTDSIWLKPK